MLFEGYTARTLPEVGSRDAPGCVCHRTFLHEGMRGTNGYKPSVFLHRSAVFFEKERITVIALKTA
jgi:hypothetical protein